MEMQRYSKIYGKNSREMVMLKGFPCKWGRCKFCDYIEDNENDEEKIVEFNRKILKNITGELGVLDVINSGSIFELPDKTLKEIKDILVEKNIKKIFVECHWIYKDRLDEIRRLFDIDVIFRCGVETFDNHFRMNVLNKGACFKSFEDVKQYFDSICLLVCMEGQTKEMIKRDIDILINNFKLGCVNVFVNNKTEIKRDEELYKWFIDEFKYLDEYQNIEVLISNTDLGVGREIDE